MQALPAQETGGRLRGRENLKADKELENLRGEVASLKAEVENLREFVKALYGMMEEGEEYSPSEELPPAIDFGRINT